MKVEALYVGDGKNIYRLSGREITKEDSTVTVRWPNGEEEVYMLNWAKDFHWEGLDSQKSDVPIIMVFHKGKHIPFPITELEILEVSK